MAQIQLYRNIFLENASASIERIILIFSRITGLSDKASQTVLLGIICYIIGIYIIFKIHRKLFKRKIAAQKECTFEYDHILYLIAQTEYSIQGEKSHSPIEELMNAKSKNYLKNHTILMEAIRRLEADTKQILFTPEMERKILVLRKKVARYDATQKIFGIILSIASV